MTKQTIIIDCETLPTALPFEEKLFWETEEEYRKTALDGNLGRLLCVGYIREFSDGRRLRYGCHGWNEQSRSFDNEAATLKSFWDMMADFDLVSDLIVGHNIMDFDLPFIIKRSVITGIKPTVNFSFARYRSRPIFDTMREWDCWSFKNHTSLDKLAYVLGVPSPKTGELSGSNVYEAYKEGSYSEIYKYCMRDVKATRSIYRRMKFLAPASVPAGTPAMVQLS